MLLKTSERHEQTNWRKVSLTLFFHSSVHTMKYDEYRSCDICTNIVCVVFVFIISVGCFFLFQSRTVLYGTLSILNSNHRFPRLDERTGSWFEKDWPVLALKLSDKCKVLWLLSCAHAFYHDCNLGLEEQPQNPKYFVHRFTELSSHWLQHQLSMFTFHWVFMVVHRTTIFFSF